MLRINTSTTDELEVKLNDTDNNNFLNLYVNNELEVRIMKTEEGYVIDTYKMASTNCDEDFLDSMSIWENDLLADESEED